MGHPVFHIGGKDNPADIVTRDTGSAENLLEDSEWFRGPRFLALNVSEMPISREFLLQGKEHIPVEELRTKRVSLLATGVEATKSDILFALAEVVMARVTSLSKAASVLARLIKAHIWKNRDKILEPITVQDLSRARKILFAASMGPTEEAIDSNKLASLRPFQKDFVYYTKGRVGAALGKLLGCEQLPILFPSTRLAQLIMWDSHCEDHRRNPLDTLARSREKAWIVRGSKLAATVCAKCSRCRLLRRVTEVQVMADIPEHQLTPCPPFTHISLDFMGPFTVKGLANQRARIKVFGLVIVCQNTRAVKVLPVPGYSTEKFLIAYRKFTNECGVPELVLSDQGSQLVKAGRIVNVEKSDLDN